MVLGLSLVVVGGLLVAGRTVALPKLPRLGDGGAGRGSEAADPWLPPDGRLRRRLRAGVADLHGRAVPGRGRGGFRSDSLATGTALFLAYALGMGAVVGAVSVAIALASDGLVRGLRRSGAGCRAPAGSCCCWPVPTSPGTAPGRCVLRGYPTDDPVIDTAASVQHALADVVAAVGPGGWLLVVGAVVAATLVANRATARLSGRVGR